MRKVRQQWTFVGGIFWPLWQDAERYRTSLVTIDFKLVVTKELHVKPWTYNVDFGDLKLDAQILEVIRVDFIFFRFADIKAKGWFTATCCLL